jgi:hypothetical protein
MRLAIFCNLDSNSSTEKKKKNFTKLPKSKNSTLVHPYLIEVIKIQHFINWPILVCFAQNFQNVYSLLSIFIESRIFSL